ncbi:single-stranded DNA-binding protein [Niastella yeongjuensis]|uniref:Single-stranded DNA-binding protein n=1 Tax=Niastella yeongjuensis TaxID=354355 RepID=A0A1V9F287_9BACT|nr:single-stranded DNA-binding protein [Niastella yeongjuensis]OQP52533.1 single-stranded DNA-binding protein [Niastella yeongjuensis]SEP34767.1 single-strand DNA-binding protein [Niastella yeongjuensis]
MYAIKNKVQLIGNLGQFPDIRTTETGKKLARFSIATNDTYRNSRGERVRETLWHAVIAWGKLAEIAEKYLTKGREVAVAGKLVHREYTDKSGIKRFVSEIVLNELVMLGGGPRYEAEPTDEVEHFDTEMDN